MPSCGLEYFEITQLSKDVGIEQRGIRCSGKSTKAEAMIKEW
jgi:hypothetical protein